MERDLPVVDPLDLPLPEQSDAEKYGVIKAPDSPSMAKAAELFRNLERRVEGSPAEFMLPGGGIAQVLERKAYGEDPSAFDYAMAGLDATDIVPGAAPLKAIFVGLSAKGAKAIKDRVDSLRGEGLEDAQDVWNAQEGQKYKGYYNPSDGQFRMEIDTSEANITREDIKLPTRVSEDDSVRLPDVLKFDDLYDQVPSLKDVKVKQLPLGNQLQGTLAAYDDVTDTIFIPGGFDKLKDDIAKSRLSSLLHEVQHAVQKREGFLQGYSTQRFTSDEFEEAFKEANKRRQAFVTGIGDVAKEAGAKYPSLLAKGFSILDSVRVNPELLEKIVTTNRFSDEGRKLKEEFESFYAQRTKGQENVIPADRALSELRDLADAFDKDLQKMYSVAAEVKPLVKGFREADAEYQPLYEQAQRASQMYMRVPGEVEARTVQRTFEGNKEAGKELVPTARGDFSSEEYFYPLDPEYNIPTRKAQGGGVQSLSPIAKDMYRGYDDVKRGVGSYIPYMK